MCLFMHCVLRSISTLHSWNARGYASRLLLGMSEMSIRSFSDPVRLLTAGLVTFAGVTVAPNAAQAAPHARKNTRAQPEFPRHKDGFVKRWLLTAALSTFSVFGVSAVSAQSITSGSVSPTTYNVGDVLTFSFTFNSGSNTIASYTVSDGFGVAYSCSPASVGTGTNINCSGTVTTTAGPTFYLSVPTVDYVSGSGTPGSTTFGGQLRSTLIVAPPADTTAPVVNVPGNITINTSPGLATGVATYSVTATDNVGVTSGPDRTAGPASGTAFPLGTTTVTHTATDAAGNTGTGSFTVTVVDNEMPVVTVPSNITQSVDLGMAGANVAFVYTSTDNVGISAFSESHFSGNFFPIGTTTLNFSATDAAGNIGRGTFDITIVDDEAPTISVPTDITVSTDAGSATAVVTYTVTAADNSGSVTPTLTTGLASGSAFPVGTTPVTWTVVDPSGNSVSGTFNVIVEDNELPVVTVPADIAVNTDTGLPTAVVTFAPTVVDAVDGPLTPVVTSAPTAGLVSGSAFPIGITTVTVAGTDTAGNMSSDSFTVTVADDQAPTFTSAQPDINLEIDFNLTTAVASFATPTATDNSGTVTVTQTQGLASGASFPLGTTLVEFTATDGAGLTATLQFNVTVSLIPPGTVTFVVNSPDDGTVTFTSGTAAFNTSVVVAGGSGSSGGLQVVPGSYTATYALPTGFAVTSASCSSASGSFSIATQTVSLMFARGESYTCTLSSRNISAQTQEQIQNFMDTRGRLIVANQPSQGRRIARVNGDSNPNSVSMFGNTMNTGVSPFGIAVGQNRIALSFSSASASLDPLTARSDWDVWFESSFSRYETSYGEGLFGILHAGADYRITENAILGFGLSMDTAEEDVIGSTATTSGLGWMVGPYYTAQIGEGLYFDASLRYGRSNIEISPLGTYVDDFETERWLASVALFGSHDYSDTLNIQPNVAINYFEETSQAYIDSLLVPIASVTTRFGELEAGSRFTWSDPMGRYSTFFEIEGIYTFEANGTTISDLTADTGLRGRAGLGGSMVVGTSGVVDYGLSYDGLGDSSYEAISVTLGYTLNF